jgi:hypothetical protein
MKAPFPSVWDSTMVSTFRSCPYKAWRMYVEHWKPKAESVDLVAGGAFASGLEAARRAFFVDGKSAPYAEAEGLAALWRHYGTFEPPEGHVKTWDRMAGALDFYFENYPLGADGTRPRLFGDRHGIEFSFAEPLPVLHPETGEPLIYAGRADMVADAFGGVFLYDEKTTTQLGTRWVNQWELRSQFTGYCWGLRGHGIKPTGVVVRGVSILKHDYETKQVPTYRPEWQLERWLRQTCRDLERAKLMWAEDFWDQSLDHACTEYSGCAFQRVCQSVDPDPWLGQFFVQREWKPLLRHEGEKK